MKLYKNEIPGCYEIQPKIFKDNRGLFVKVFHEPTFEKYGLCTRFKEEFYSTSYKNVLRGMHFQLPPHDHAKLVYCTAGRVIDVVIDLRVGSPSYGKHVVFDLSLEKRNVIYIPEGLAHGYIVTSEEATIVYKIGSVYSPDNDSGVRWDSIGFDWPSKEIIISDRDRLFRSMDDFHSPFTFPEELIDA